MSDIHRIPRKVGWRFIARRYWTCRRDGHKPRKYWSSSCEWNECYCGLRCFQYNPSAGGTTG